MPVKKGILWITGISLITTLTFYMGWGEIRAIILKTDPLFLTALFSLQLVTLAIGAYQWHFLIKRLQGKLSFSRVFTVCLASGFVESVTPSSKLGGEAAKIYLLRRETNLAYEKLTGALLTHKFFSLLPFVLLCGGVVCYSAIKYELHPFVYSSFFLLALFFLALCSLLKKSPPQPKTSSQKPGGNNESILKRSLFKANSFIKRSSGYARQLATSKERHTLISLSLIVWFSYPVKVFMVATMLDFEINFVTAAVTTFTAYLISMIPLFPGGLGTFEGSMAFMFSLSGLSPAEGLAVALLSRSITYWFPLIISAAAATLLLAKHPINNLKSNSYEIKKPLLNIK